MNRRIKITLSCFISLAGLLVCPVPNNMARAQEADTATNKDNESRGGEYIRVEVRGRLATGVVAIGGETTGSTITARGITWELDFASDARLQKLAHPLSGKMVTVTGDLERRQGVTRGPRWIVHVTGLESAGDKPGEKDNHTRLRAVTTNPGDRVSIHTQPEATVAEISSKRGIGRATLERVGSAWPRKLQLRLNLSGLESLQIKSGKTTIRASVSSVGRHATHVWLSQAKQDDRPLDKDDAYYLAIRIVGGNGIIPLRDGYFEVVLPKKLLADNPRSIEIEWIDFYRQ